MTGIPTSFADADLPALFRSADMLSIEGRKRRRRYFIGFLLCDLGAAFCSAFDGHPRALSIVAVVLLIAGLGGTVALLQESPEADWYRGRALAESVKTLSWRYMMCAEPYTHGLPIVEADRKLIQELEALLKVDRALSRGLNLRDHTDVQITDRMRAVRYSEVHQRKEFYLRHRLKNQKVWYSRSAGRARTWLAVCRWALVGIQLGLVLAAFSITFWPSQVFSPVGLLSALAASVIAWQQLNEFAGIAVAYNLTSHELAGLESLIGPVATNKELEEFVLNAERAISREHTLWRARRTE
jgi:hypothetical protein